MKKIVPFFILICFILQHADANEKNRIAGMSNNQIDSLLFNVAQKQMTITEKMNYFSLFFLGTPYNFQCVGDGQYALVEPFPLVNFKETNCMALCEHVLAMSISDNWDNFFNNLQQIRYKDGLIGMKTRNHYTMADWLPENNWILEDVAQKVGGPLTKSVTRTISHKRFFAKKGIEDMSNVLPDRIITVNYVPMDALADVAKKMKTGDILALLFANLDDIFSAHMLMVADKNGQKIIRESSNSKMSTFDTPYFEWVSQNQALKPQKYLGLAIMRVKEEINQPGKIIQPWEIAELKKANN